MDFPQIFVEWGKMQTKEYFLDLSYKDRRVDTYLLEFNTKGGERRFFSITLLFFVG